MNYIDDEIKNEDKIGKLLTEVIEMAQEIPSTVIEIAIESLEEEIEELEEEKEKLILRKELLKTIYKNRLRTMREEAAKIADKNL